MGLTLSGCSAIQTNNGKSLKLIIFNTTTESHVVDLQIFYKEDTIAEQNLEIAAGRPNDGTKVETTMWKDYKPSSAEFELKYRVDGIERVENMNMNCGQGLEGGSLVLRINKGIELDVDTSCII